MRASFVQTIREVALEEPRLVLLIGDIGAFLLRDFKKEFPDRLINMGISEANMMSTAAGLALSGKAPFVYTITPFTTSRCFEQIKDDVCYQNQNVKIVGVGSGLSYSVLGSTHHSLEDIAILRNLPNMTIVSPADPIEVAEAVRAAVKHPGPLYLRIALAVPPLVVEKKTNFVIGEARLLRDGHDCTVIATGELVREALRAAFRLSLSKISCRVVNMHTLKPIDEKAIVNSVRQTRAILTVEEHSVIGGLGSAVAEVLAEGGFSIPFRRLGMPDIFSSEYGHKNELLIKYGFDSTGIEKAVKEILR